MLLQSFWSARSNVFSEVKGCLKGVFGGVVGYGKSPCFSRLRVLGLFGVDWRVYVLALADGGFFLD
jgi:hypothetical protein